MSGQRRYYAMKLGGKVALGYDLKTFHLPAVTVELTLSRKLNQVVVVLVVVVAVAVAVVVVVAVAVVVVVGVEGVIYNCTLI
jgi:hypothetical protein